MKYCLICQKGSTDPNIFTFVKNLKVYLFSMDSRPQKEMLGTFLTLSKNTRHCGFLYFNIIIKKIIFTKFILSKIGYDTFKIFEKNSFFDFWRKMEFVRIFFQRGKTNFPPRIFESQLFSIKFKTLTIFFEAIFFIHLLLFANNLLRSSKIAC